MKFFTDHPASVGETYFEHMGQAFALGAQMVGCGLACLLHGIFPMLFEKTASEGVERLYRQFAARGRARSQL